MVGETLVGCRCKKTVSRRCQSGITFFAFSKVPPISASAEEEIKVLRVFYSVKIGPFGVGLPLE